MPDETSAPIFSFIIPVYNTKKEYLYACLDSVLAQDFDKSKIEVILIDDCSTDPNTQAVIQELSVNKVYKGLKLKVVQNPSNMWLAETRNVGVSHSTGRFLVCLDSDDTIEKDYLTLSYLALAAYPNASWVYPSVRKFGVKNKTDIALRFSAKELFLKNYMVMASPVKRELWEELGGQRTFKVNNHIKLFEDWDFWQRALKKKHFGIPVKKVIFNYRQNISSLISRTEDLGNLSVLMSYRKNWTSVFGIKKSQERFNKDNLKYVENKGLISSALKYFARKLFNRNPKNISISDILLYIFAPQKFINKKIHSRDRLTKTHKMAGFTQGFSVELEKDIPVCKEYNKTALCTHFSWHVGGAENILLDYMHEIKNMGYRVADVVMYSQEQGKALKDKFSQVADFQISLHEIAEESYPKLLALWELIKIEKPGIILNMSNPLLYILSPLIKEKFPKTVIYDLLHCEEFDDNGWFEAAYHYQEYIDRRIVTSHFWKDVLIKKYSEKAEKIDIIYNMINYDAFLNEPKNREEKLEFYKISPKKKIIGFLGRFHEQKNPHIFIRLAEIMENFTDFHFVMAGDGPLLKDLLPKMKSLKNLTYVGATKNPEKFFTMFDVAVFPSKFEGYPLVGIECAQINLPIIASDIVGFREIITNGNMGILYEVKSEEEDTENIKKILTERYDELLSLGKNGSAFVDKFHNRERIIQDIRKTFTLN